MGQEAGVNLAQTVLRKPLQRLLSECLATVDQYSLFRPVALFDTQDRSCVSPDIVSSFRGQGLAATLASATLARNTGDVGHGCRGACA